MNVNVFVKIDARVPVPKRRSFMTWVRKWLIIAYPVNIASFVIKRIRMVATPRATALSSYCTMWSVCQRADVMELWSRSTTLWNEALEAKDIKKNPGYWRHTLPLHRAEGAEQYNQGLQQIINGFQLMTDPIQVCTTDSFVHSTTPSTKFQEVLDMYTSVVNSEVEIVRDDKCNNSTWSVQEHPHQMRALALMEMPSWSFQGTFDDMSDVVSKIPIELFKPFQDQGLMKCVPDRLWNQWVAAHCHFTKKSKCYNPSGGLICQDSKHSHMRRIASWCRLPAAARILLRRAARGILALIKEFSLAVRWTASQRPRTNS